VVDGLRSIVASKRPNGLPLFVTGIGALRQCFTCMHRGGALRSLEVQTLDVVSHKCGSGIPLTSAAWEEQSILKRVVLWKKSGAIESSTPADRITVAKPGLFGFLQGVVKSMGHGASKRSGDISLTHIECSDGDNSSQESQDGVGAQLERLKKKRVVSKRKVKTLVKRKMVLLSRLAKPGRKRKVGDDHAASGKIAGKEGSIDTDGAADEPATKKKKIAKPTIAEKWDKFKVGTGGSFLCHDERTNSMGAHCVKHGPLCRANKILLKAPMGYLLQWLALADDPAVLTIEDHLGMKNAVRLPDAYDDRKGQRDLWLADPELEMPFLLEALALGKAIGEVDEPRTVK
jgi:hypothetical protein